jgi:hypothetical protein
MWARANIRQRGGATERHYGEDCCVYLWLCPCATCQDCRELKVLDSQDAHQHFGEELQSVTPAHTTAVEPLKVAQAQETSYTPAMLYDPQAYQFPPPGMVDGLPGYLGYPDLPSTR